MRFATVLERQGSDGHCSVAPDGRFIEFVPLPDPLCTNPCFGHPNLQTAYVTLSGAGRLVSLPWSRPGLRLNY
jgi:gluconolactonase